MADSMGLIHVILYFCPYSKYIMGYKDQKIKSYHLNSGNNESDGIGADMKHIRLC